MISFIKIALLGSVGLAATLGLCVSIALLADWIGPKLQARRALHRARKLREAGVPSVRVVR